MLSLVVWRLEVSTRASGGVVNWYQVGAVAVTRPGAPLSL
jgi:hypothetical protein